MRPNGATLGRRLTLVTSYPQNVLSHHILSLDVVSIMLRILLFIGLNNLLTSRFVTPTRVADVSNIRASY